MLLPRLPADIASKTLGSIRARLIEPPTDLQLAMNVKSHGPPVL
jgi:hypothetical protein